jgi:hypothetical protein
MIVELEGKRFCACRPAWDLESLLGRRRRRGRTRARQRRRRGRLSVGSAPDRYNRRSRGSDHELAAWLTVNTRRDQTPNGLRAVAAQVCRLTQRLIGCSGDQLPAGVDTPDASATIA